MSTDPESRSTKQKTVEALDRAERYLAKKDEELKQLDEEILEAERKHKTVSPDPEPGLKSPGENLAKTEFESSPQAVGGRARWKWFLALGVLLLVLGTAGIGVATFLELMTLLVFAPMLMASSLIQLLAAFFAEKGKDRLFHWAAAGVEAVLGFVILADPLQNVVSLITWIAVFLVVAGLIRLARSLATQSRGRAWFVMTGVFALLLGIAVWIGGPVAKLWFVGLCIAVDFICHGVCWSALALAERKPLQDSLT